MSPIELRFPGPALTATTLWLVFLTAGLLTALLAPKGDWGLGRWALGCFCTVGLIFVSKVAIETHTYRLRANDEGLTQQTALGTRQVRWDEVASVTVFDSKRNRDAWEAGRDLDMNERPFKPLDIRVYELRDAKGAILLELNADLKPASGLLSILKQLEPHAHRSAETPGLPK